MGENDDKFRIPLFSGCLLLKVALYDSAQKEGREKYNFTKLMQQAIIVRSIE